MKKYTSLSLLLFLLLCTCSPDQPAENLGIFGKDRLNNIAAQDGVTPVPINKNHFIWTFGDTLIWKNPDAAETSSKNIRKHLPDLNMISNSMAISYLYEESAFQEQEFIYLTDNEKVKELISSYSKDGYLIKYWPAAGVYIDSILYLFLYQIRFSSAFPSEGFSVNGVFLLKTSIEITEKGIETGPSEITPLFTQDKFVLGDSVTLKDDKLYLSGRFKNEEGAHRNGFIAKVKPENIQDKEKYMFFTNDGWSNSHKNIKAVANDISGEYSLHFLKEKNSFIITYCDANGYINCLVFNSFNKIGDAKKTVIYKPEPLEESEFAFNFYYSGKQIYSGEKHHYSIYIHPVKYQPILLKTPFSRIKGLD